MMLYVLRHAEAEPHAADDASRRLTAKGELEVVSVASQFANTGLPIDRCLVSPYLRAKQTAEIFLAHVNAGLAKEETPLLIPEVRANAVLELLDTVREEHVLLVSHNPVMSELGALLTEGNISNMHILGTSELIIIRLEHVGLGMGSALQSLLPDSNHCVS